jgi:Bacterial TSP3 repeat
MLCSLLLTAVAMVGAPAPSAAVLESTPYRVVAQGLVELSDGTYAWSHTAHELTGTELEIEPDGLAILLARGGGSAMVTGSDGVGALLGNGEATFSREGVSWTAIAMAESGGGAAEPATQLDVVALASAAPDVDAFEPGAGVHDVELRHVELAAGETVESPFGHPTFVVVLAGPVAGADGATIESGDTAQLDVAETLTNAGEQQAVVLMAVIGPAIEITADVAATVATTNATPTTSPPPPPPPPTTTSTTTTTTTAPPIDLDGDGLTDDEEAALGTDHNDPDSDDDDLTDGEEVDTYGTNPLSKDTDGDELPDAGEIVTFGSDPLDPDTDDDGLLDIEPVNWGTSPTKPDTDDDGLLDGQEVNDYGSNPHQTDSDGDSLGDGDEVNTWGSSPTNTDSDGDNLIDGEEVFGTHTNPADDDSDGDGIDDGTEAGNGTDPNDANDP